MRHYCYSIAKGVFELRLLQPVCIFSGLIFISFSALVLTQQLTVPAQVRPSVETGASLYAQNCSSCHGDKGQGATASQPIFSNTSWSERYAPSQVVLAAQGKGSSHQAVLEDDTSAWHITAYVWTLPLTALVIQEGQQEAMTAAGKLEQGALALILTKGADIKDIQDVNWVLNHTKADITNLINDLAEREFSALTQEQQTALIDYIYASHFELPQAWQ